MDFGAEESFVEATKRAQEHYGLDVAAGRVRRHSLEHGALLSAVKIPPPKESVSTLVAQLDGSLIPIVEPSSEGPDRRKGKQLHWREVAESAGLGADTKVHGVGDGAEWITTQFKEQFGEQGNYLVDFWHVSDCLAAAATVIQPEKAKEWRHCQQGRLLENNSSAVIRSMTAPLEPEGQKEAPVRDAHRYLSNRLDQLDYAGARAKKLPIGSGEIESSHGHVIQERLKRAGCWWRETNAEAMLGLRVARSNNLWDSYWKDLAIAQN